MSEEEGQVQVDLTHRQKVARFPAWTLRDWIAGVIAFGFLAVALLFLYFEIFIDLPEKKDTACKHNLMSIGTALEIYGYSEGSRYGGHPKYPERLDQLAPYPLKVVPTCPVSGKAYTYVVTTLQKDARGDGVQEYTVYCAGENHPRHWAPNYPQYTSRKSLVTKMGPHSHLREYYKQHPDQAPKDE